MASAPFALIFLVFFSLQNFALLQQICEGPSWRLSRPLDCLLSTPNLSHQFRFNNIRIFFKKSRNNGNFALIGQRSNPHSPICPASYFRDSNFGIPTPAALINKGSCSKRDKSSAISLGNSPIPCGTGGSFDSSGSSFSDMAPHNQTK